jgi:phosphoribosyl-AMP cyclohydrolase / phosphoribosyl-ATP pyrophosphohydrolase
MRDAGVITYDAAGLVTAVAQDATTGEILMVAHMNREALERTLATGEAWYWSRSRRQLWRKGETSGHTQHVRSIRVDCDGDAVLLTVDQIGPACHMDRRSCFFRMLSAGGGEMVATEVPASGGDAAPPTGPQILSELAGVLSDRRRHPHAGSYSSRLFAEGLARLNEKIMEEAAEVARAARREAPARLVEETADLWFHTLALLVHQGVDPTEVFAVLASRRR